MSLLVWLPLTETLENKGLNNITFSNTGSSTIVINNNGKIGKCYNRSSIKTAGRIISDSTINLNGDISMFCWAKVTECVGDTANGLISNHSHTNNTGFGITIKQISTSDYRISCSTGNGSNRTYNRYYGTSNIKDKWSHLGLTYDNTKKEFKLWVDGICEKTVSYTNSSRNDYIIIFDWSTTFNLDGYKPACSINDVRIYDHCLSPKEVKEISKGLVLHYKLDDIYYNGSLESTLNLATYSTNYSNKNYGEEYNCASWGGDAGTVIYYASGGYNNGPYKVYHKTATGTGGIYNKLSNDIHIESCKTYTMSVYIKASRNFTDSANSFNINRTNATQYSNGNRYITYGQRINFTTTWQRLSKTFTATNEDAGEYGEMSIIYNDTVTDYYVYYSCFQVEENDHATLYVNGSRNLESTTNLLDYSNLQGHYSSWTLQSNKFNDNVIYRNTVINPNTTNNAGFSIKSQITNSNLSASNKVTLSFYKKLNTVYGKNLVGYLRVIKSDDTESIYHWSYNKPDWANNPNSIGLWEYIYATVTIPEGCKAIKHCYVYADNATDGNCDFSCIQLELKDHPTPYVKGTRNLTNTTIYDSSGYENNGSIIGTLTLSNNSPRYNNCIYFNGHSSINIGKQIYNITDAISVCFWCKGNNIPRALSCTESGGWNFEYSSGKYNFAIYTTENKYSANTLSNTVNDNIWHFVVGTFDGINKKIYTDGLLSSSITLSQKYLIKYNTNVNLYIGQESPSGNMATGYMSDVRIYATAISEDDILKLYNNSAHIDDNNNLYGFEFEEDIITNPKILKNGIVKIDNFVEPIGYIYLPAGTYINTGINYANGDECKCETTIRYESGGSGRDLMGYSDSGTGYWGVTSTGTWEAHGTFTYSNSDITQINNIIFIHSSDIENGEYKIGSLLGSYSVRGKYIYKVRLYKNGTLMRDFYPIKIDNKIGLYDLITNEYYLANNENGDIFYNKSDIKMYKYLISSNELIEK